MIDPIAVIPAPEDIDTSVVSSHGQSLTEKQADVGNVSEADYTVSAEYFNPGWAFYTSFTSLCIITLAVALDATTISVALPVRILPYHSYYPGLGICFWPRTASYVTYSEQKSFVLTLQVRLSLILFMGAPLRLSGPARRSC